jgi:hypothetical protein
MRAEEVLGVILPNVRDPRFVTIRRGGTLTDSGHRLLALWAATCAEHVLDRFESARPEDLRPRRAIEEARAWARGQITMSRARTAGGHAMGAARDLRGAARYAAYAAARRQSSPMSPRTSSVRPPMRSRPHVLPRRTKRPRAQGDSSAGGSASNSRRRFASSCSTTSGCATTSAGRCSTADTAGVAVLLVARHRDMSAFPTSACSCADLWTCERACPSGHDGDGTGLYPARPPRPVE